MPDYRELYFELFRATERAINTLVEAQQRCEEQYLQQTEDEGSGQMQEGWEAAPEED